MGKMDTQKTTTPKWYWPVVIFFLLWNLMGISSFFQHIMLTDAEIDTFSVEEQELYKSYPFWTVIAFSIATFGGLIGSIGLIMKKKWAKLAFIVSLIAIIPQMTQNAFFTNANEIYGNSSYIMPISVTLFGFILVWFSNVAISKKWLT
jgi:hypothetical protein